MNKNRRNVLAGIGIIVTTGLGAPHVLGKSNEENTETRNIGVVDFKEANYEEEYVVFENNSDEPFDASNWVVSFDFGKINNDKRGYFPKGTIVDPGKSLYVATGATDYSRDDENTFVKFGYQHGILRDDGSNVIALLTRGGDIEAISDWGAVTEPAQNEQEEKLRIKTVNAPQEFVVFENTGDEDFDISGYTLDLEYLDIRTDQEKEIPDNNVVPAGGTWKIMLGAVPVTGAADNLGFEEEVLNNDGSDRVVLHNSSGVVVTMDDETVVVTEEDESTTTEEETTTADDESGEETTTNKEETTTTTEDSRTDSGSDSSESSDETTSGLEDTDSSSDTGDSSSSTSEGSSDEEASAGNKEDC